MPRKLKEVKYQVDPNTWMSDLSKKGITVYPEVVDGDLRVAVKETIVKNGKESFKVMLGKEKYNTNTINDGLLKALEYMHNKTK